MSGNARVTAPLSGAYSELDRHRTVQELKEEGGEVPDRYRCKESSTAPVPLMEVPVIDMNCLPTSPEELQKLRSALSSWGCFQVINHGIEFAFLDELLVNPEDNRKLHYWPQNPKSFREVLEEYTRRQRMMVDILLISMAKSLDLAENSFLKQHGERPKMHTRFNFYPPCPRPDFVEGLKPHVDAKSVTILLPDEKVEGLQYLKDDRWVQIQINPRALLVNAGDQMEIMSNGIFKSPIHKVVTNTEKERISVATLCTPGVGEEVGPVKELISDTRPRMYKTVKDYREMIF